MSLMLKVQAEHAVQRDTFTNLTKFTQNTSNKSNGVCSIDIRLLLVLLFSLSDVSVTFHWSTTIINNKTSGNICYYAKDSKHTLKIYFGLLRLT